MVLLGGLRDNSISPDLLVSVITIVMNGSAYLEDTIESVLSQDYPNIEYIIIDGGSTDGTLEIIEKYRERISKFVSEPDQGIADAMNKGIRMSAGDIIGIIHSSDYYQPAAVSSSVNAFLENPEAGVVHGNMILVNPKGISVVCGPLQEIKKDGWKTMPVLHPTLFVRKAVYERFGLFDLSYKIAMDYDLVLRFLNNGVSFKHVNRNIATMRTGGLSWTNLDLRYKETREVANKYGYSKFKVDALYLFNIWFRPLEQKIGLFLRSHGMTGIAKLYHRIFYPHAPDGF